MKTMGSIISIISIISITFTALLGSLRRPWEGGRAPWHDRSPRGCAGLAKMPRGRPRRGSPGHKCASLGRALVVPASPTFRARNPRPVPPATSHQGAGSGHWQARLVGRLVRAGLGASSLALHGLGWPLAWAGRAINVMNVMGFILTRHLLPTH